MLVTYINSISAQSQIDLSHNLFVFSGLLVAIYAIAAKYCRECVCPVKEQSMTGPAMYKESYGDDYNVKLCLWNSTIGSK